MRCRLAITAVSVAGVAALAGCTAAGDPVDRATTPATETAAAVVAREQVVSFLTELGTSSDPSRCTELYTSNALPREGGAPDVQACEESVSASDPADEVLVDQVVVAGDRARARVTATGGDDGGLAQTLDLVREGDAWKVDGVAEVAVVDRDAVHARFAQDLAVWGPQVVPPEELPCIDDEVRAVSDAEMAGSLQEGRSYEHAVDAISRCLALGVEEAVLSQVVQYQLTAEGLTAEQADCVVVEASATLIDLSVADLVTSATSRERLDQALVSASRTQVCQQLGAAP